MRQSTFAENVMKNIDTHFLTFRYDITKMSFNKPFINHLKMVFAFVLDQMSYHFYSIADWWIEIFRDF